MHQEDPKCAQDLGIRDPKSRGTRQVNVGEQSDSHVETMMACCML